VISEISEEFQTRFNDFDSLKPKLQLFHNPMDTEMTQQPFDLHMELCDLQSGRFLFIEENESPEAFWKMLSQEVFSRFRNFSLEMLSLLGSTCVCEAAFSTMNIIKSRMRNRLDISSLQSCLRLYLTDYQLICTILLRKNRLKYVTSYISIIIVVLVYWY
jgi:hypothetical protein